MESVGTRPLKQYSAKDKDGDEDSDVDIETNEASDSDFDEVVEEPELEEDSESGDDEYEEKKRAPRRRHSFSDSDDGNASSASNSSDDYKTYQKEKEKRKPKTRQSSARVKPDHPRVSDAVEEKLSSLSEHIDVVSTDPVPDQHVNRRSDISMLLNASDVVEQPGTLNAHAAAGVRGDEADLYPAHAGRHSGA